MILITGATGQIGGAVIEQLADAPGVRALVRKPAALLGRPATSIGRFLSDHRDRYIAGTSRSYL
jgi:uncharacterized protein YbjT (DUF2867 family)